MEEIIKKCKYCQSDIDINAVICPKCGKRQNKSNLALALSLSIGIPAVVLLIIVSIIIGIWKDSEENKKQRIAELIFTGVEYAYTTSLYESIDANDTILEPTIEDIYTHLKLDGVTKHLYGNMIEVRSSKGVTCTVEYNYTSDEKLTVNCPGTTIINKTIGSTIN